MAPSASSAWCHSQWIAERRASLVAAHRSRGQSQPPRVWLVLTLTACGLVGWSSDMVLITRCCCAATQRTFAVPPPPRTAAAPSSHSRSRLAQARPRTAGPERMVLDDNSQCPVQRRSAAEGRPSGRTLCQQSSTSAQQTYQVFPAAASNIGLVLESTRTCRVAHRALSRRRPA